MSRGLTLHVFRSEERLPSWMPLAGWSHREHPDGWFHLWFPILPSRWLSINWYPFTKRGRARAHRRWLAWMQTQDHG